MSSLTQINLPENRCPVFMDGTAFEMTFKGVSLQLTGSSNELTLLLPPAQQLQVLLEAVPSKALLTDWALLLDTVLRFYGVVLNIKAGEITVWSFGVNCPPFNMLGFQALTIFLK